MDDLYFDGDPATDSTRRRLERVMKGETRPRWPWIAALAAGSTALLFWQVRRRRRNHGGSAGTAATPPTASTDSAPGRDRTRTAVRHNDRDDHDAQ